MKVMEMLFPISKKERQKIERQIRKEVDTFWEQHPDAEKYHVEMARLISQYGSPLSGAYRVAKERMRMGCWTKRKKRGGGVQRKKS